MPREQITHSPMVATDNPNVFDSPPRRNVHVSWNAAGWVQVGIDVTLAEVRSLLQNAEEGAANAVRDGHPDLKTELFPVRVVSDVIERAEMNRFVKVLRNARDRAYGRDE